MAARTDSRARGFVLPTTILVMTLLTVMLAAAFALVSAEFRTTDSSFAMRRAYTLAQAGLSEYLTMNRQLAGLTYYDSLRIAYSTGYADVVARKMVDSSAAGRSLWTVRSTGVITAAALTGEPVAMRTVAVLARLNAGTLPAPTPLVAANPVVLKGVGPNPLRGQDQCAVANRPALLIARGDYQNGSGLTPTDGIDSLATRSAVLDSTHIDWVALVGGDFTPDYVYPTWPTWSGYPVGLAPGDATIGPGGRVGILVVQGNLTLNGGVWNGIILVGGWVRARAGAVVNGMVVSGLNNLITPNSVLPDSIDRGAVIMQWNSCNVANVLTGMAALSPLRNSWIDTWSMY